MEKEKKPKRPRKKTNVVTRRISLHFNIDYDAPDSKDQRNQLYDTIKKWMQGVYKAANMIATHFYMLEHIKYARYLKDGEKMKLESEWKSLYDESKKMIKGADGKTKKVYNPEGALTTSLPNSAYQILSDTFKGELPMNMLAALNQETYRTMSEEMKDYKMGNKSLRSYKYGMPAPFPLKCMVDVAKLPDGNWTFTLFKIPLRTYFGKNHLTKNQEAEGEQTLDVMFDKAMRKQDGFELLQSKLLYDPASRDTRKNKSNQTKGSGLFLLATIGFESNTNQWIEGLQCFAELGIDTPIIATIGSKEIKIGSKSEFLHQRLAIRNTRHRAQRAGRYIHAAGILGEKRKNHNNNREKKFEPLEYLKEEERRYIINKLHVYSSKLIRECRKNICGVIVLKDQTAKEEKAKKDKLLLSTWSYYGLINFIEYKAKIEGIIVIKE